MIATSVFLLPNGTFFVELVTVVVILAADDEVHLAAPQQDALEARQEKIRDLTSGGRRRTRRSGRGR
jgi:hypothetical protein